MKYLVQCSAIAAICIMEIVAISHGINGVLLTTSIASVAAIGGYQIGKNGKGSEK